MAKLTDEIRTLIVTELACHRSHTETQKAVRDRYGVEVTLQQVAGYDPETVTGGLTLGKKWKALHAETRARYYTNVTDVAVSHRGFRLRELWSLYAAAKGRGNVVLAASLLEQCAKEMGEAYTNRRVVIPGDPADELGKLLGMSVDEVRELAAGASLSKGE